MRDLPIACTLDAVGMRERAERWTALADRALVDRERREGAMTLRFTSADGVADEVRELVRLEGECCAFLEMRVEEGPAQVVLEIASPPEADAVLPLPGTGDVFAGR